MDAARETAPWFVALRDLLELAEEYNLDAAVGDDKFDVIVRARQVLHDAANSEGDAL